MKIDYKSVLSHIYGIVLHAPTLGNGKRDCQITQRIEDARVRRKDIVRRTKRLHCGEVCPRSLAGRALVGTQRLASPAGTSQVQIDNRFFENFVLLGEQPLNKGAPI